MSRSPVVRALVDSGIVSPFDLAPGYPALLPHGLAVTERLQDVFRCALRRRLRVEDATPPLLIDAEEYSRQFGRTYDYANVYSLAHRGRDHVVRPDGLAAMLADGRADAALVSTAPLFRAETADPQPLIRDKHLGVVTQVVHQVGSGDLADVWAAHAGAFRELADRLLLPTLFVETEPLRSHAERRLLTFSVCQGRLWLTSTIYLLDDELASGLGARGRVVEVGFTGKLVALAVALHADDVGVRLPRALCPGEVLVADDGSGERVSGLLADAGLRPLLAETAGWRPLLRQARRQGIPLAVGTRGEEILRYERVRDDGEPTTPAELPDRAEAALAAHDARLWEAATAAQECLAAGGSEDARLDDGDRPPDGWFSLGQVVDANFELGRAAAERNAVLLSGKRRLY